MSRAINHRELSALVRTKGAEQTASHLREALEAKQIKAEDFSIRELAEHLIPDGREFVNMLAPGKSGGISMLSENAVKTTDFGNITGPVIYSKVNEGFKNPLFIGDSLVDVIPTQFSGERIPAIGQMGDKAESVTEGQPYPMVGLNEDYIDTAATVKKGLIIPVTKEAIFFDRTGLLLRRCAEVGYWLGVNKEKRIINTVTGQTGYNNYNWKGTTSNTYNAASPWANSQSNTLTDYKDIEDAQLLLDAMTDPSTGEPIMVMANAILVPTALKYTAARILNSTEVRVGDGASTTVQTISQNPLSGQSFAILSSQYVKSITTSASTWYFGDFKRAFAYMQNWPLTVSQSAENSEVDFTNDIVLRYKASERGVAQVIEPRCVVKNT